MTRRNAVLLTSAVLFVFLLAGTGIALLLNNITRRQVEGELFPPVIVPIAKNETDPAVWGVNFPRQYDSYLRTIDSSVATPYNGSVLVDKLERTPFKRLAWAGMPFSKEYNSARGHHFAQIDQANSRRTLEYDQPGTCLNCHTGELTRLIDEMGWETVNKTPYKELAGHIGDLGVSCADCHEPDTMKLRISRPALTNALASQGIDVTQASRQEMRTYVCAQCHVEYYFSGPDKALVFPWSKGTSVEQIEEHLDEIGHKDWTHEVTGAPMLKMQHPEYELYSTSVHAASGVSCADCHMPYTREGGVKVSDHWIRSPLTNLTNACQNCHRIPEEQLRDRVLVTQNRTQELVKNAEAALEDAIHAIAAAIESGSSDDALVDVRRLHRRAQMRWDFVVSENSMGFHSPQEAARILANAVDLARQAELQARLLPLERETVREASLRAP